MINVENTGNQIQIKGLMMNGESKSATLYKRMVDSNGQTYYMYSMPELGIRLSEVIASSPENAVSQVLYKVRERMNSIVKDAEENIKLLDQKIIMFE